MKYLIACLVSLGCMLAVHGCKSDDTAIVAPPPPVTTDSVSFSQKVLPILNTHNCIGCHGGQNHLFVNTVAGLLAGGDHGPAVIPSKADSSLIIQKTNPNPPFGARMPLGLPPLSDNEIATIKIWINQGARNN